MTTETKTANIQPGAPAAEAGLNDDRITLTNDIRVGVVAAVSNGLLGLASIGYVQPGGTVLLPSGAAWWDVYLLQEKGGGVIFETKPDRINWDAMKSNVNSLAHLKVSEFY